MITLNNFFINILVSDLNALVFSNDLSLQHSSTYTKVFPEVSFTCEALYHTGGHERLHCGGVEGFFEGSSWLPRSSSENGKVFWPDSSVPR